MKRVRRAARSRPIRGFGGVSRGPAAADLGPDAGEVHGESALQGRHRIFLLGSEVDLRLEHAHLEKVLPRVGRQLGLGLLGPGP